MQATYHWLQMTCTKRNENAIVMENTFQMERGTLVPGHPPGCEAQGNGGDASVDLLSSDCTWSLQWQK